MLSISLLLGALPLTPWPAPGRGLSLTSCPAPPVLALGSWPCAACPDPQA